MDAVEKALGWIVAIWILMAVFNEGYAPYYCMAGAMVSVAGWALYRRKRK